MNKMKLAICMKDLEYQARFVNCFMNHYKHQYEVHVFTSLGELELAKPLEFSVIITGEYSTEELANFVERGEILLYLTESEAGDENETYFKNLNYTEKYQEVYKIAERLPHLAAEGNQPVVHKTKQCKWIGVYSLNKAAFQIAFASLLAKLYGEEEKVLVLDLQSYSALTEDEDVPHMGLEDLMSVATTGAYSRGRILNCIGHESNWDYVYPVKNNQCLAEGTAELYETILEILEKEQGYQRIIINFGDTYAGQFETMARCQEFYLLGGKPGIETWRENLFRCALETSGKTELLSAMKKIEIPTVSGSEETWRSITDKWYWNSFGQRIRQLLDKEIIHGAVI